MSGGNVKVVAGDTTAIAMRRRKGRVEFGMRRGGLEISVELGFEDAMKLAAALLGEAGWTRTQDALIEGKRVMFFNKRVNESEVE